MAIRSITQLYDAMPEAKVYLVNNVCRLFDKVHFDLVWYYPGVIAFLE